MKYITSLSAAAVAAAASAACALGAVPPQQAAPIELDHVQIKNQQTVWERANGLLPGANNGPAVRGVCPNSVTNTPAVAIPQFNVTPGIVTDTMTTSGDPLLNVRVRLNITHTWQGDVIASLRHDVSGIEVTLIDRPGVPELSTVGFSADNYGDFTNGIPFVLENTAFSRYDNPDVATPGIANVTGPWLADDQFNSLSVFDGLTGNTTWTLTVSDNAGGDLGVLQRWTICSDNALGQNFPTGVGSATPNPTTSGSLVTFSVQVSPAIGPPSTGLGVVADLSTVGGGAFQTFFDDGSNGDAFPGDNIFTYQTTVTGTSGVYSLPFTVSDAEARSSGGSIGLTIVATNDFCEAAINVPVGTSIITTNEGATNDVGLPTCSGLLTFNAGVWFTTTGTGNILNATTCSGNTVLNTRLYVYTGSCGFFTCVAAATGTSPVCSPTTAASVSFCSNLGETYYILVTNDTTGTGQFELAIFDNGPCPANDNCPGDVVTAPSTTAGSTVGFTPSGAPGCVTDSPDAYFNFTPTVSGTYQIDTCGADYDTRLSVYTDCPAATVIGCNDDFTGCGLDSGLILNLTADTTYYIRVHAFGATTTGAFILNISAPPAPPTGACCTGGGCIIVSAADCANASGTYQGDNSSCVAGTFTSDPAVAIPDNGCATFNGVSDSLVIPSFSITSVSVRVQIPAHTFLADLEISITNGFNTVVLMNDQCGGNDGMDVTFQDGAAAILCALPTVGTYAPLESLSVFNGSDAAGTWTLMVCDDLGADTGTLESWSLVFDSPGLPSVCGGGPMFCDADWCQDGAVGVPDIFCFLADWFAGNEDATGYGGTSGVPAIFAFLAEWFATPQGPCTP